VYDDPVRLPFGAIEMLHQVWPLILSQDGLLRPNNPAQHASAKDPLFGEPEGFACPANPERGRSSNNATWPSNP